MLVISRRPIDGKSKIVVNNDLVISIESVDKNQVRIGFHSADGTTHEIAREEIVTDVEVRKKLGLDT